MHLIKTINLGLLIMRCENRWTTRLRMWETTIHKIPDLHSHWIRKRQSYQRLSRLWSIILSTACLRVLP